MTAVSRRSPDICLRQLIRLRTEMEVASVQMATEIFPDFYHGIEYGVVARVCLPDWIRGDVLERPEVAERSISIRKIALSTGRAPETTRRRVNRMCGLGMFAVSPRGVSLAVTPENEALALRYFLEVHDRFVRLIEDVSVTCDLEWNVTARRSFGIGDVLERAIDSLLLSVDTYRMTGNTGLAHLLWGALTMIAVRGVTYDPVLSRLYADAIPPDELRVGISLRRLAATLSIPYATAWRQMQALEAGGLVTRIDAERWTVLTRNLLQESVRHVSAAPSVLVFNKIRELAMMGLDPAHAAAYYRVGRPPLAQPDPV
ncbi:hypothetical protein P1X14_09450 [Sphingomonas sp. AOB5]|uniref:hypothetical protein n=1 Tax=Sphingomonas sp. AOB5 TaxID=3034017 RepID=UPI0023F6E541|nr:hypothetical protein [Sphingomonas sp. AOB5]MDF7775472.1 hypothetical protein [Sphingomonas sp. AOB5]